MVKTVAIRVTVTQSQAFSRSCRHEVSSMFAASVEWTETASRLYGASRTAALRRSSLEIIPAEIDGPKRSADNCWICLLLSR